jgi:hypothetical protein
MIGAIAIIAAVVFAAGMGAGFLALVVLGIHREERQKSMTLVARDRVTRGARRANGMHSLTPGVRYEPTDYRHGQPQRASSEW